MLRATRVRRLLAVALVTLAVLSTTAGVTKADPGEDLKKAQQELQKVQNEQSTLQHDMEDVSEEARKAWNAYAQAQVQLQQAKVNLAQLNGVLNQTQDELKQVTTELDVLNKKHAKQSEALAGRLRALHQRGRVSYLTVLLGSTGFKDFLLRWDMLKLIVMQDSSLIGEMKQQQAEMQAKKDAAQAHEAQILQLKSDAETQAQSILQKRDEQAKAANALDSQKAQISSRIEQMESRASSINDQIGRLALMANHPMGALNFINPLSPLPVVTDPFGWRMNPILYKRTMHWGTDFGAPPGTSVMAVADGIVAHAEYDSVFGNLVIIDHGQDVKGREVVTWYAHNSRLKVSQGERVKQGQVISLSGATGWATGPHVHFEVHLGAQRVDPMEYLPG